MDVHDQNHSRALGVLPDLVPTVGVLGELNEVPTTVEFHEGTGVRVVCCTGLDEGTLAELIWRGDLVSVGILQVRRLAHRLSDRTTAGGQEGESEQSHDGEDQNEAFEHGSDWGSFLHGVNGGKAGVVGARNLKKR